MTKNSKEFRWVDGASSEGGPYLITSVENYAVWTGAVEEFDENAPFRVWYYGSVTLELSKELLAAAPNDHQVKRFSNFKASGEFLKKLTTEVMRLHPDAKKRVQKQMSWDETLQKAGKAVKNEPGAMDDWLTSWKDHTEAGIDYDLPEKGKGLHISINVDNDYWRACDESTASRYHPFEFKNGIIWDVGPGVVDVAVSDDQKEIVCVQIAYGDNQKDEEDAKNYALGGSTEEKPVGQVEFPTGEAMVIWAPVNMKDLVKLNTKEKLSDALKTKSSVRLANALIIGLGSVHKFLPGKYQVMVGKHEAETWKCYWLRLKLVK